MKGSSIPVLLPALVWLVTYTVCFLVLKEGAPSKPLGFLLSFLPIIAFAWFLFAWIRGVGSMDEVEIRIQMEAAVIAFSLSLLLIMTLGLLDLVVVLKKADWSYRHLVPYFITFYYAGLFFSRRKYR